MTSCVSPAVSGTAKLERYPGNPILSPRPENAWESVHVSNAGAIMRNGKVHLLYRAEGPEMRYHSPVWHKANIGMALSKDGFDFSERLDKPVISMDGEEEWIVWPDGVEDPRITEIDGVYYIVYATTTVQGDRMALATTEDFVTFRKHGLLMGEVSQRTAGLFPEKFNGRFMLMHRPLPNIWISETEDFKTWTNSRMVMSVDDLPWCEVKLGIAGPPIRTEKAWALIFHGKDRHRVYRLGIAWLDLEDPSKVIKIQKEPILEPESAVEKDAGFLGDVVYACGQVIMGDQVIVYYGAGDAQLFAATMPRECLELP